MELKLCTSDWNKMKERVYRRVCLQTEMKRQQLMVDG